MLSSTSLFKVIDTTLAVLGYTLRHGDVLLALSSQRWVQFRWGRTLTVRLNTCTAHRNWTPRSNSDVRKDPWVQSRWGSNSDVTLVRIRIRQTDVTNPVSHLVYTSECESMRITFASVDRPKESKKGPDGIVYSVPFRSGF